MDWVVNVTPRQLYPGKDIPTYRRLGGSQGRSGRVRKTSLPPEFDPWTVQPVAIHYTGGAIHNLQISGQKNDCQLKIKVVWNVVYNIISNSPHSKEISRKITAVVWNCMEVRPICAVSCQHYHDCINCRASLQVTSIRLISVPQRLRQTENSSRPSRALCTNSDVTSTSSYICLCCSEAKQSKAKLSVCPENWSRRANSYLPLQSHFNPNNIYIHKYIYKFSSYRAVNTPSR